ncbi:inter-alpha-trypsin inhibitor heavy chain H4 isoform X1 [Dipodomys spectabilis]|uniref:inter-alpha-trypsin inhibitor heavy chain H4 isoform X1 n=1 Tax=Dipodomys spectabilis TaxID=105255 RepID=UPI001C53FF3D|nr:inter-alpha-trypsin inhibitor heavy chain H4 isoform X1 [Dipodomys spectabilis]
MKNPAAVHSCSIVLVFPLLLSVLHTATAQKNDIDIYSLTVDSKVSSRFAHTVITSRVVNRADTVREATFQMELPKKAFITNFSMIIDGVTYPGNIKEKAKAQEEYSTAVRRGESAGLIKATGRKTEQFQVSVNVAPSAKVTFELVYEELLRRHLGAYELLLKVQPQQLVKHLQMDIHIFEPQGISFLETESTFMTNELEDALMTSQNKTKAHIRFKPTLSQQQKFPDQEDTVLDGSLIIRYDVNRTLSGGSIQIENGYFVHYFAPEDLPTMPKNVIFVIDKSGSMSGRKIQQTREALIQILNDLSPKDQFNLIVFNGEATQWKSSLVPASAENVKEATSHVASIHALGGTNINDAMLMAVKLLESSNKAELLPARSISIIILLTDGDPTVGVTDPTRIQKNVQEAIGGQYSLFCLGFGFDVSYTFLEKMALENNGLARRIYEDSDSALQLQDFYQEVSSPLLSAVAFEYSSNSVEAITKDNFRLFFKGSEMVVAGKLQDKDLDVLSAKVSGQMHMQNITFQTESNVTQQEEEFRSPKYIFHNFMERLWAYLTIQQQLEQIISAPDTESQALQTQALNLSLKYNFVTPLTSMVVTRPEGQKESVAEKPVENSEENKQKRVVSGGYNASRFRAKGARLSRLTDAARGLSKMNGQPGPLLLPSKRLRLPTKTWRDPVDLPFLFAASPTVAQMAPSDPHQTVLHGVEVQIKETTQIHPSQVPFQAPAVTMSLPGPTVDRLCVDIKHSQGPLNLLSDQGQGLEVTGQYEIEKAGFSWIKVIFKNPQLRVHATPEHVVVTQNRKNSAYKWKETLYLVLPGLKMTMDKKGLLLLSGPDKATIGVLSWHGPEKGLLLLLRDTDRFSSLISGTLGQFYKDPVWSPPETEDDSRRTLRVQGTDYSATREVKLDYQEGTPGTEISCWLVEL